MRARELLPAFGLLVFSTPFPPLEDTIIHYFRALPLVRRGRYTRVRILYSARVFLFAA
jgi:hypothetical protein